MFKPGSIRKIQVKNFVTYSYVEMYPGPNLNMIIGPNGTGKSTMVAAIILGLGGNPKVVGRGTRLAEYVKHNCETATINIYLQTDQENKYLKVTREFDTRDRTTWMINGRKVLVGEVQTCISEYNIQVNNLCQFLPQDRVQDFAKLNKKELLRNTQIALCRDDLIEKQNALVSSRERHKECLQLIDRHSKKLEEAQDQNARLEGRVKNLNKKKKCQEKVDHIERKIAWTIYDNYRAKLSEIKTDRNQAQEVYDKYKNSMKPMENDINSIKKNITETQQKNSRVSEKMRSSESTLKSSNEKIEMLEGKIRDITDDMNSEIAQIEQWEKEIEGSIAKLEEVKALHREAVAKCQEGDIEKQALSTELTRFTTHLRTLQDKKEEVEQTLQDSHSEIRAIENEQRRLENVKQMRFQALQRIDQQAYEAVMWLRNNRHLFKHEIFEPMMLEINVLDNRKAIYVESCVPLRDRLAFTCVDKQDMNLLIRCLRNEQKLSVNILHSGFDNRRSIDHQFQPDVPIERLRRYGFYTYVKSLFTAPEPIMYYLCKTYGLHNIPVGDASTNNCFEQVPKNIKSFFSDKFRFHISYSKYSGEKSTRQTEVRKDGGLSMSLDMLRLEQLKGRSNEIKRSIEQYTAQIQNVNTQISKLHENIGRLRDKLRKIQSDKQHAQSLDSRIQTFHRNINEMRQRKKSPDDIRQQAELKIKKFKLAVASTNEMSVNEFKNFSLLLTQSNLNSVRIDVFREKISYLENSIAETRRHCQEAEETLNTIKDKYASAMQEAKAQLVKAKTLSKGFTPADEGFDEFREIFEGLTADMQELNSEKEMLLSRMACLNTADNNELREYEDRLKAIENLSEEIETANSELNKVTSKMDRLQQEWLTPLKDLILEINVRFAMAFERMGCAGEVSICTGENDKDFSEYGLCIKVTYRNGEPLQELNSNIQSGGERAVATAAFMLSLQELTPVPFRCVDEINQGMDANNERRIFELIVETTCQPNTAQYFLITPKLVPHLRYSHDMAIHIVHNGPFVVQDKKWSFSTLCNPQSIQIH